MDSRPDQAKHGEGTGMQAETGIGAREGIPVSESGGACLSVAKSLEIRLNDAMLPFSKEMMDRNARASLL